MQELSETDSGYAYRLSSESVPSTLASKTTAANAWRNVSGTLPPFRPVEGRGAQQQVAVIRHGVGNGIGDARSACPA